ncbi:MAG TPA: hypothetical protein DDZ76_14945, partial [Xanthomonadales bacterium]|nr:hypothetical protein [Xanthomonadales bacterium]
MAALILLMHVQSAPLGATTQESGYTEASRQVVFAVATAAITVEAVAKQSDAKVRGLVAEIKQMEAALGQAHADARVLARERDDLARAQEALIAELSARDASYARAISAFRDEVSEIAKDPEWLKGLALYNQGQVQQARSVLKGLAAADQRAREAASKIQYAAQLRAIAALTRNAIGRDGTTTDQAIADYEAVVALDAVAWDWQALAGLYLQQG